VRFCFLGFSFLFFPKALDGGVYENFNSGSAEHFVSFIFSVGFIGWLDGIRRYRTNQNRVSRGGHINFSLWRLDFVSWQLDYKGTVEENIHRFESGGNPLFLKYPPSCQAPLGPFLIFIVL
jgi:hypothetical protein